MNLVRDRVPNAELQVLAEHRGADIAIDVAVVTLVNLGLFGPYYFRFSFPILRFFQCLEDFVKLRVGGFERRQMLTKMTMNVQLLRLLQLLLLLLWGPRRRRFPRMRVNSVLPGCVEATFPVYFHRRIAVFVS